MASTECFTCLNTFIGWGNPDANVWFVGLEDAGQYDTNANPNDIITEYSAANHPSRFLSITAQRIIKESTGKPRTPIYNYMAYVLSRLRIGTNELLNSGVYRDTLLAQNHFKMNVRSLALDRTIDWPAHYSTLFGITHGEYSNLLVEERYPLLRAFHARHRPKFTVCFGSKHWQKFEQMFGLPTNQRIELSPYVSYHLREGLFIFLTPFFGPCGPPLCSLDFENLDCVIDTVAQAMQA